jgi:SAM-dependent methyltransferase
MAQNMRFDDVAFYAHQCSRQRAASRSGCGNGRILLPLLARGPDAYGVDASAPMLRELARKARPRACRCARAQPTPAAAVRAPTLGCVLLPYSLVTYSSTDDELAAFLRGVHGRARPWRLVVVDAFVPRPFTGKQFTPDYRRAFGAFTLARAKRITPPPDGTNRIERRYELVSGAGDRRRDGRGAEVIRPRAPGRAARGPCRRRLPAIPERGTTARVRAPTGRSSSR